MKNEKVKNASLQQQLETRQAKCLVYEKLVEENLQSQKAEIIKFESKFSKLQFQEHQTQVQQQPPK